MPTYRNETGGRVTWGDKHYIAWQPGEERALPYFVPFDMLGLTKVSDEPFVLRGRERGFDYAEFQVAEGASVTWTIPYSEAVELSVFVPRGAVKMYLGDSDVPIVVDTQNNHVGRYPWDMSAYATFEGFGGEAVVFVKSEPFTEKGE